MESCIFAGCNQPAIHRVRFARECGHTESFGSECGEHGARATRESTCKECGAVGYIYIEEKSNG
jgi:hypothetical protein